MKKVLFSLPVLAFSLFLAFCSKSNVQEEIGAVNNTQAATSRGTCDIQIVADNLNTLRVCGIPVTNKNACNDCGLNAVGVEFMNGAANYVGVTTPVTFSVTNVSATTTYVRVTSATTGVGFIALAPGACQTYTVDNFCTVN